MSNSLGTWRNAFLSSSCTNSACAAQLHLYRRLSQSSGKRKDANDEQTDTKDAKSEQASSWIKQAKLIDEQEQAAKNATAGKASAFQRFLKLFDVADSTSNAELPKQSQETSHSTRQVQNLRKSNDSSNSDFQRSSKGIKEKQSWISMSSSAASGSLLNRDSIKPSSQRLKPLSEGAGATGSKHAQPISSRMSANSQPMASANIMPGFDHKESQSAFNRKLQHFQLAPEKPSPSDQIADASKTQNGLASPQNAFTVRKSKSTPTASIQQFTQPQWAQYKPIDEGQKALQDSLKNASDSSNNKAKDGEDSSKHATETAGSKLWSWVKAKVSEWSNYFRGASSEPQSDSPAQSSADKALQHKSPAKSTVLSQSSHPDLHTRPTTHVSSILDRVISPSVGSQHSQYQHNLQPPLASLENQAETANSSQDINIDSSADDVLQHLQQPRIQPKFISAPREAYKSVFSASPKPKGGSAGGLPEKTQTTDGTAAVTTNLEESSKPEQLAKGATSQLGNAQPRSSVPASSMSRGQLNAMAPSMAASSEQPNSSQKVATPPPPPRQVKGLLDRMKVRSPNSMAPTAMGPTARKVVNGDSMRPSLASPAGSLTEQATKQQLQQPLLQQQPSTQQQQKYPQQYEQQPSQQQQPSPQQQQQQQHPQQYPQQPSWHQQPSSQLQQQGAPQPLQSTAMRNGTFMQPLQGLSPVGQLIHMEEPPVVYSPEYTAPMQQVKLPMETPKDYPISAQQTVLSTLSPAEHIASTRQIKTATYAGIESSAQMKQTATSSHEATERSASAQLIKPLAHTPADTQQHTVQYLQTTLEQLQQTSQQSLFQRLPSMRNDLNWSARNAVTSQASLNSFASQHLYNPTPPVQQPSNVPSLALENMIQGLHAKSNAKAAQIGSSHVTEKHHQSTDTGVSTLAINPIEITDKSHGSAIEALTASLVAAQKGQSSSKGEETSVGTDVQFPSISLEDPVPAGHGSGPTLDVILTAESHSGVLSKGLLSASPESMSTTSFSGTTLDDPVVTDSQSGLLSSVISTSDKNSIAQTAVFNAPSFDLPTAESDLGIVSKVISGSDPVPQAHTTGINTATLLASPPQEGATIVSKVPDFSPPQMHTTGSNLATLLASPPKQDVGTVNNIVTAPSPLLQAHTTGTNLATRLASPPKQDVGTVNNIVTAPSPLLQPHTTGTNLATRLASPPKQGVDTVNKIVTASSPVPQTHTTGSNLATLLASAPEEESSSLAKGIPGSSQISQTHTPDTNLAALLASAPEEGVGLFSQVVANGQTVEEQMLESHVRKAEELAEAALVLQEQAAAAEAATAAAEAAELARQAAEAAASLAEKSRKSKSTVTTETIQARKSAAAASAQAEADLDIDLVLETLTEQVASKPKPLRVKEEETEEDDLDAFVRMDKSSTRSVGVTSSTPLTSSSKAETSRVPEEPIKGGRKPARKSSDASAAEISRERAEEVSRDKKEATASKGAKGKGDAAAGASKWAKRLGQLPESTPPSAPLTSPAVAALQNSKVEEEEEERKDEKKEEKMVQQLVLPRNASARQLANLLNVSVGRVEEVLSEELGEVLRSEEDPVSREAAELLAMEFGRTLVHEEEEEEEDENMEMPVRAPVVTIMGHVDHGKTSLLDALRKTAVAAGEAGGITQHIGAFEVVMPDTQQSITFLDTPGHAAFSSMRARGASVTDIVVLVVAADDGVMATTREALAHARAANVPIVVAITKVDIPGANIELVKRGLLSESLELEEYGGDVQVVLTSAKTGQGLDDLASALLLQADLLDLRVRHTGQAIARVVEARNDQRLGPVATIIVLNGVLMPGDPILVGLEFGKVRSLRGPGGELMSEAKPGQPVQVAGLRGLPEAGDELVVQVSEERARRIAKARSARATEYRRTQAAAAVYASREKELNMTRELYLEWRKLRKAKSDLNRENNYMTNRDEIRRLKMEMRKVMIRMKPEKAGKLGIKLADIKTTADGSKNADGSDGPQGTKLSVIIKADVQGSLEALCSVIQSLTSDLVNVRILYSSVGHVTESDVNLAITTSSHLIAFNLPPPEASLLQTLKTRGLPLLAHNVIYHLLDELRDLIQGAAPFVEEEVVVGRAEVQDVFPLSTSNKKSVVAKSGRGRIAGVKVLEGSLTVDAPLYRVERDGVVIWRGPATSLRHVKEDVKQLNGVGKEGGVVLANGDFSTFEVGDEIQCIRVDKVRMKVMLDEDQQTEEASG